MTPTAPPPPVPELDELPLLDELPELDELDPVVDDPPDPPAPPTLLDDPPVPPLLLEDPPVPLLDVLSAELDAVLVLVVPGSLQPATHPAKSVAPTPPARQTKRRARPRAMKSCMRSG